MRILVFGGSGQLGSALVALAGVHEILVPSRQEVDIADAGAVARALEKFQPGAVVNCAAFNRVDAAETECEHVFTVNALAVNGIALACRARDITFMTMSTDYVFDGTKKEPYVEKDPPHPLSVYGISKYSAELLVERLEMRSFVVRTCGLYGDRVSSSKGYTFIDRILTQARKGEPVRVVDDLICSPTYAADLARALVRLLEGNAYGLYHAVNEGAVSWYAFAEETLRQAGISCEIEPVSSGSLHGAARRPHYSALSNAKLAQHGVVMPTWQDGIRAYLAAGKARG